jgi:hypothetical protein
MRNYDDEMEDQRLRYAANEGLCPDCCTELDYYSYHERDSTYDAQFCPKCGWRAYVYKLDEYKDDP